MFFEKSEKKSDKLCEYIEFSHYSNSNSILSELNRIDASLEYVRENTEVSTGHLLEGEFQFCDDISDYNELIDFHNFCFADDADYCKSDWAKLLDSYRNSRFPKIISNCYSGNRIVGTCIGQHVINMGKKYLYSIAVHPEFRGKKIGHQLIHNFLKAQPQISSFLHVLESAESPIHLYEKNGFKKSRIVSIICRVDSL